MVSFFCQSFECSQLYGQVDLQVATWPFFRGWCGGVISEQFVQKYKMMSSGTVFCVCVWDKVATKCATNFTSPVSPERPARGGHFQQYATAIRHRYRIHSCAEIDKLSLEYQTL